MEQNTIQWLRSPSCQRGSYSFYKSVSCRAHPDGPLQVWRLGEFYYVRRGPQEPVCIAEVTLLWEEQGQHPLLASSRLYFLPEDTPKGRTRQHGEDEVLAVCRRIVVPVEDLMRWACPEPVAWQNQKRPCSSSPAPDLPLENQGSGTTEEPTGQSLDQGGGTVAELTSGTIAELTSGTTAELTSGTIAELTSGTIAELTSGTTAELTSGTIAELTSGTTAELTSGTIAELTSGTTAEPTGGTIAELTSGTTAELTSGTTAELTSGTTAELTSGTIAEPTSQTLVDRGSSTETEPTCGTTAEPTSGSTSELTSPPLGDPSCGTAAEPTSHPPGGQCNAPADPQGVKVLSYPQYCRFRSLQRRLQDRPGVLGGADPRLLALGGLRVALSNTRVMFCRETFTHPSLDASSALWPHFRCPSLSLRGRPRKKKQRDVKESPTLTRSQSESWIDKMKENMMGSADTSPERAWLPHPEEQLFLDQLFVFMERFGRPINKVPNLGFKKIDLFRMYSVVQGMGGYEKVTSERLWKVVYNDLGGCPGSTSAATCTRRHYERLMLGYEEHVRAGGAGLKLPESPAPTKFKAVRGKKAQPRGRKPGAKAKQSAYQPAKAPAVNPDGTAVVKRGRGRPPGRRNKATLLAQAKLLAQQQAKAKAAVPPSSSSSSPSSPPSTGPAPTPAPTPASPLTVQSPPPKPALQVHTTHMPLTPDLSPLTAPMLPFLTKPGPQGNQWAADPPGGATVTPLSAGSLLSGPPGQPLILGTFSPSKGVCPLDTFRTRLSLHHGVEDPALHKPLPQSLQSAAEPCPAHNHHHHNHQPCAGCVADGAAQKGAPKEGKARPPLPPLRVFPLDLDCSVQVRQLMRTPLGAVQLHSFTRRLSEVLAQDLGAKPLPHPCSPITPPPEQAQPLNLSQRAPGKRPAALSLEQTPAKRPAPGGPLAGADGEELGPDGRPRPSGSPEPGPQEEPADLSSPSRIRAFLMGLPPFSVNLDDDLEDAGSATSLPVPPPGEEEEEEEEEEEPMEGVDSDGGPQRPTEEDEGLDVGSEVADVPPPPPAGGRRRGGGGEGGRELCEPLA
ncbi:NHS-like protein 1 isoform X2 [Gadus macrocephalus]|uniref:NHS-like protein 1 isoform X2 n=1 Tax=Gadus macrocephalus TaxID=80720 RepID=UPI0028CB1BD0|nr:NHS-like protein 1 isoform X2 [Gadus macrocephalus]